MAKSYKETQESMRKIRRFIGKHWQSFWLTVGILAVLGSCQHTAKADEANKKLIVAVIDTGVDVKDYRFNGSLCPGYKDFTGTGLKDTIGHGTHVSSIILRAAGGISTSFCILELKYYSASASNVTTIHREVAAFKYAIAQGATIINLSGGGPEANEDEYDIIEQHPEVTFIVAAGNHTSPGDDPNADHFYPCAYAHVLPNITCVGALDAEGGRLSSSNSTQGLEWQPGEQIRGWLPNGGVGYMTGSSMATAIATGRAIRLRLSH